MRWRDGVGSERKDDSAERACGPQLLGRFGGELELKGDLSPAMRVKRGARCQLEAGAGSVFFHPREDDQGGRYDSVDFS